MIIGEGPDREKVEEEIRKEGVEKKVSLLGFRPDVRECMQDFDIFLMSSKTEGLGTSVLDAMALGIPVVSTNAGGLPEIVKDEKNGMLCEVKDIECLSEALMQLLGDDDKRERLGRSGIETAKQRSREKMASSVLATYRSVLERTS